MPFCTNIDFDFMKDFFLLTLSVYTFSGYCIAYFFSDEKFNVDF